MPDLGKLINPDALHRVWRSGQPFCLVEKSGAQSINDSTLTDVTWGTDISDTWGMHDTVSNTERVTIPKAGRYLCIGIASWAANATGQRQMYLEEVGSLNKIFAYDQVSPSGASLQTRHLTGTALELEKDVYIKMVVRQTSGGALNIEANTTISQLMVVRIG